MKYVLFVASLIFSLFCCEVIIRGFELAPQIHVDEAAKYVLSPNPMIGYELAPGYDHNGFRVNSFGFRDREYTLNKPDCVYRIAVIGDSICEGLRILDEKLLFHSIVEEELNNRLEDNDLTCNIEIINFGVNGYNTLQEAHTLRDKAIYFSPDLVLIQYALNDTYTDEGRIREKLLNKAEEIGFFERTPASSTLLKSHLYRFVRFRVFGQALKDRWERHSEVRKSLEGQNRVDEAFALIETTIENVETTKKREIPVLVMVFPFFDEGLFPYPYVDKHSAIKILAQSRGFHTIDLLESFQACAEKETDRVFIDHVHPSVTGHRCVADLIEGEIWERYLSEIN
jgi:lysophospholipase L1-like esterase